MWKWAKWTAGATGVLTSGTVEKELVVGAAAEFFKNDRYRSFNRTGELTDNRKINLMLIQLADSYQSVSTGGNTAKSIGKLIKVIKREDKVGMLFDFGIDWAKGELCEKVLKLITNKGIKGIEIFLKQIKIERMQIINSLRDSVGLNIITDYSLLSSLELSPQANKWIEKFIEIILAFPENKTYEHEVEAIIETLKVHEEIISSTSELEESELKNVIIAERKVIQRINEENINLYLEKWENWGKHIDANKLVNSCLKKLREKTSWDEENSPFLSNKVDENEYLSFLNKLKDSLLKDERFNKEFNLEIKKEMNKELSIMIENINLKINLNESSSFNFSSIRNKLEDKLEKVIDNLHYQFQKKQENYNLNVQL
ncbi:MAG TPA: hypothetical protein VN854_01155 [Mycoplasmatales bacterium]|jgi:predicted phage-related endonuclease|nr:hypothetical protein [Mycoplasmatales bacterium]